MVDVCYSSEKRTSVERTGGIFRWKPRPATNSAMDDFPIVPPLIVKDMPRPRRLTTLKAARDYVRRVGVISLFDHLVGARDELHKRLYFDLHQCRGSQT
jgi:hypothetical protein